MSLPVGAWRIDANGFSGQLNIAGVSAQGDVTGTLHMNSEPVNNLNGVAFWDDTAKKITFMRVINPAQPGTFQIYTGYFFPTDHTKPNGQRQLAGSFEAFSGTGAV